MNFRDDRSWLVRQRVDDMESQMDDFIIKDLNIPSLSWSTNSLDENDSSEDSKVENITLEAMKRKIHSED